MNRLGSPTSIGVPGVGRFRTNIYQQRGTLAFAFRAIPYEVKTVRELYLPEVLEEISLKPRGLVLVTGIIDRLERRNLVVRQIDPSDRRRFRLSLTPAGLAASQEIDRALTGDLADQLATSSPGELSELGRSLHLLERTLVALDARTGLQGPPSAVHDMPAWSQNEPDVEIPGRALANSRN